MNDDFCKSRMHCEFFIYFPTIFNDAIELVITQNCWCKYLKLECGLGGRYIS